VDATVVLPVWALGVLLAGAVGVGVLLLALAVRP
jgi:hypothetical protein